MPQKCAKLYPILWYAQNTISPARNVIRQSKMNTHQYGNASLVKYQFVIFLNIFIVSYVSSYYFLFKRARRATLNSAKRVSTAQRAFLNCAAGVSQQHHRCISTLLNSAKRISTLLNSPQGYSQLRRRRFSTSCNTSLKFAMTYSTSSSVSFVCSGSVISFSNRWYAFG